MKNKLLAAELNVIEIFGVAFLILMAIFFRFYYGELPCPLCLLQRLGVLLIAFGFMLNMRFGFRSSHYGLSLIAAVFTAIVAGRQILLHIVPGSGSYGQPFLGLHLYTWNFIIAVLFILYIAILLTMEKQYRNLVMFSSPVFQYIIHIAFYLLLILTVLNVISAFFICGLAKCPDFPRAYQFILGRIPPGIGIGC